MAVVAALLVAGATVLLEVLRWDRVRPSRAGLSRAMRTWTKSLEEGAESLITDKTWAAQISHLFLVPNCG